MFPTNIDEVSDFTENHSLDVANVKHSLEVRRVTKQLSMTYEV
jgi:hypothetical protein